MWISGNVLCQLLKQLPPPFWESTVLSPWKGGMGGMGDSSFLDNLHFLFLPWPPPSTLQKKNSTVAAVGGTRALLRDTHIPVQTSHMVSGGSWVQSCCNSTWAAEGCDGLQPEQLQLCTLQPLPPRNKGWPSLGNKLNLQAQGCLGKLWALKNLKETFVTKFETKDFLGWIGIG